MHPVTAVTHRFFSLFPMRRAVSALLACGGAILLSAQSPLPVETNPAVIAAALEACDAGDFDNCYVYGRAMLANAARTPAEDTRAYDSLEKACNGGVALACYSSGWRYIMGNRVAINLKKARKFEAKGCAAGDDRACNVVQRLDNPPASAAFIKFLSPGAQGNVNMALYVNADGAEQLSQYADAGSIAANADWKWNLKAASCEMGNGQACRLASLAFTDIPGFKGEYKPDNARAAAMARAGCDNDDAMSCMLLGTMLKWRGGTLTADARAAYAKAIPGYQIECEAGEGYYCNELAWMNANGIGEGYYPITVAAYYQKGCSAGYQPSCIEKARADQAVATEQANIVRMEATKSARVECDNNDADSCFQLGTLLQDPNGNLPENSRLAYQRAIPEYKKLCAENKGYYCESVAWINLQGIDEKVTIGGLNFFTTVDPYRKRGCELGYKKSCDEIAQVKVTIAQTEADERARAQRRADEEYGFPRDTAVLQQCLIINNDFNNEIEASNKRGEAIVAGANASNVRDKEQRLYWDSEKTCDALLIIAERAGSSGCAGKIYNGMMEQFPKFTNLIGKRCESQSRKMGANWNVQRY